MIFQWIKIYGVWTVGGQYVENPNHYWICGSDEIIQCHLIECYGEYIELPEEYK